MLISKEPTGKIATLEEEDEAILLAATQVQPCCIIPARAGSKRIKHKNRKLLNGRPLFDYALKAALDSGVFHLIIVTSDDLKILEHTYSYFATEKVQPQKRPKTLCGDKSPVKVAIRYAIQSYKVPDVICLMQPTNPLITPQQIKDAYDVFIKKKPEYLIGMCKGKDIGFHIFTREPFFRDFEKLWDLEGTNWIPYEMDGIDIDTIEDWEEAEKRIKSL